MVSPIACCQQRFFGDLLTVKAVTQMPRPHDLRRRSHGPTISDSSELSSG